MIPPSSSPMTMNNTVIVFDFDDTLFPSQKLKEINSRSNVNNDNNSSPNYSAQSLISRMTLIELKELVELSWNTLNLLKTYINRYSDKNICIVSASTQGWVEQALKLVYNIGYFQQIYHLMFDEHKITVFNPSSDIIKSFGITKICKSYDDHPCFPWKYNVFEYILAQKY